MLRAAALEILLELLVDHAEAVGDLERLLSDPPDPAMGDVAFGCFALAKVLRRNPAQIARELAGRAEPRGLVRSVVAAGPYLNFRADPEALLDRVAAAVADGSWLEAARAEAPERVMIEFSQPNTHKTFHVGHLRNVVLGDSLVRIHRARGHRVVAANYYGDYGIDVAKCLWWLRTHPELSAPETGRTHWLGAAYSAANEAIAADTGALDGAREVLAAMERREGQVWALYQQTRQWCLDEFAETYRWLGVHFDVDFFESEVEAPASAIVDRLLEEGVFTMSDGAVVCDLQPELETPALVRKRDGTSLYLTWDLALARQKFEEHEIERSLYVVGSEQRFHFQQLFLTLQRMGYERAKDCRHVAYELVMLPEGKMSSRKGTAIPLHALRRAVSEAIEAHIAGAEAEGRSRIPQGARDEVIDRIAVASLRYGMLRVGTNKRVVFDIDDWTNPQGDTGAYLLYSVARMRSIARKAGVDEAPADGLSTGQFGEPEERVLLTHVLELPRVIARAEQAADPSILAGWCHEGARAFNQFFNNCPVLQAEPELREARLRLIRTVDAAMTAGLAMLGITPVDAM